MKGQKFKILLIVTLICTLVISAPMSVSAKSKAVGKVTFASVSTGTIETPDKHTKVSIYAYAKNGKKYEFYRAKSAKGKYKKVGYSVLGGSKDIKGGQNLSFYKVRGINGKKKGKFSSPMALYRIGFSEEDFTINVSDTSVTMKFLVNNKHGKCNVVFDNKGGEYSNDLLVSCYLTKEEIRSIYNDKNIDFDEDGCATVTDKNDPDSFYEVDRYERFTGKLVDQSGKAISSKTIKKGETGYIFVKYSLNLSNIDKNDIKGDNFYTNKDAMMNVIRREMESKSSYSVGKTFRIKSGGKNYRMSTNLSYSSADDDAGVDYECSGWIESGFGIDNSPDL